MIEFNQVGTVFMTFPLTRNNSKLKQMFTNQNIQQVSVQEHEHIRDIILRNGILVYITNFQRSPRQGECMDFRELFSGQYPLDKIILGQYPPKHMPMDSIHIEHNTEP